MKYFAIIFLIGFLWITRDIIRVPETFNDSWFKQFAGNQFIDPQVSWINQYFAGEIIALCISAFSDLFHLLGTICVFLFLFMIWLKHNETDSYKEKHQSYLEGSTKDKWAFLLEFIIISFICFGAGAFLAQGLWRNILN